MFSALPHQNFIANWFNEDKKKLLLYHSIGSGKTCTAILAMNSLLKEKKINKVYCVTSASLIFNFTKELLSQCGKYESIPNYIHVISYQKFIKLNKLHLTDSLVIVDEVQNIVSEGRKKSKNPDTSNSKLGYLYSKFKTRLNNESMYIIFLSATPIYNNPYEIALTLNLLSPNLFDNKSKFNNIFIS